MAHTRFTILYVDDEPVALELLKTGLEERGYDVLTALSGVEALELLQTHEPEALIVDLRMSPMNGFEFVQTVKKIDKFRMIPVMFLTGVDDYLAQKYGQTLGAEGYFLKPVDLENLDTVLKRKLDPRA
jgi:CheY-like chemotaxis protein